MSLTAKRYNNKSVLVSKVIMEYALEDIDWVAQGNLSWQPYWELTQEEADEIANHPERGWDSRYESLMKELRQKKKSPGAMFIAARINAGDEPNLHKLSRDWIATKNIRKELSEGELASIGATPAMLRRLGIWRGWQARRFYELYKHVRVEGRVWCSSKQVNQMNVFILSTTPNYNRLPLWVKQIIAKNNHYSVSKDRPGDVWRLIPCAKAWKHCPELPKNIAEKVGKMSVKARIVAKWAWEALNFQGHSVARMNQNNWVLWGRKINRTELTNEFYRHFNRLLKMNLVELMRERQDDSACNRQFLIEDHNCFRLLTERQLKLPFGYLLKDWGRYSSKANLPHYLDVIKYKGKIDIICQHLFGNAGKKTQKLFSSSSKDAWEWASSSICNGNADVVHKVLSMTDIIKYQSEAIPFLKALPITTRIRLLGATKYKYRGEIMAITDDYIRDTGYLWNQIENKPELKRIRCWFSAHELLSTAYVSELPDEPLPIPKGWERVDGLCSVNGSWQLELPKNVATLKYWGKIMQNCVGGYGNAIKQGRSVIFVVKEGHIPTHCVEVCGDRIVQFYRSRNQTANEDIQKSVLRALNQTMLLSSDNYFYWY